MATKNKTKTTNVDVFDFINSFVDKQEKKEDSYRLIELMRKWSGFDPKMYGPSIIGFGNYHYKYASGHEGDAPLIAFSPRKAAFTLYVIDPDMEDNPLLAKLGRFKMSKCCIYFKKLSDLNIDVLEKLSKESIRYTTKKWPSSAKAAGVAAGS